MDKILYKDSRRPRDHDDQSHPRHPTIGDINCDYNRLWPSIFQIKNSFRTHDIIILIIK